MEAEAAMSVRPASLMPRAVGWMYKMLPLSAGTLISTVGSLVENHPQMKVFVAECPQVGRVLRPLLRMAGMTAPEWLALPRRRRDGAVAHPSPVPSLKGRGTQLARPRVPLCRRRLLIRAPLAPP